MTLYLYGWICWIWRFAILIALGGGGFFVVLGIMQESWMILFIGFPLVLPALFFGAVVAIRVTLGNDNVLQIDTLLFWKRYVPRSRLGSPKYRSHAYLESGPIYSPRLWIPVKAGFPIYFDLLGTIPDPKKFREVFGPQLIIPSTKVDRFQ